MNESPQDVPKQEPLLRLNMGCGQHHKEGWVNVDKYAPADVVVDLDFMGNVVKPGTIYQHYGWPWETSMVDEVLFHHSLEHMGSTTESFFHIMKELYRVCKNDAKVVITVPHPRNDDFINDPTHVRVVTLNVLALFSKMNNEQWAAEGRPNTPLALQLGVNFNIEKAEQLIEPEYHGLPDAAIHAAMMKYNNVVKQQTITLKVVKQS